jgi:hypothetical protein
MESASTYQAVEGVAPGQLELARKPVRDPGPGEVRIRVEAEHAEKTFPSRRKLWNGLRSIVRNRLFFRIRSNPMPSTAYSCFSGRAGTLSWQGG